MTGGLLVALLAWGVFCTALLILVLGAVDDIRAALRREKALRAAADALLTTEQLAIRDTAVQLDIPAQDAAARLEAALWRDTRKGLM